MVFSMRTNVFRDAPLGVVDVAFCYQAGANACHVKPVRHDHHLLLCSALIDWLASATLHTPAAGVD